MNGKLVENFKEFGGNQPERLIEAGISLPVNDPQGLAERWNRPGETHLTWRKDHLVLRHYALPENPVEEEVGHFLGDLYRLLRLLVQEGEKVWAGARA